MKKIIKSILMVVIVILSVGCLETVTPSEKVEELLNKYIKNDESLSKQLDDYIDKQELTGSQKERYKNIIKDEYSSIKYNIKEETINVESATVEVEITVKDLYKAGKTAESDLKTKPTDYYTDGKYDESKFIDHKLDIMEKNTDTVNYTLYFNLLLTDKMWVIEDLDEETLEKIHGIYEYDESREG